MRSHLNTYILQDIDDFVSKATCTFMGEAWRGTVDGLCFQMAVGLRQVGSGYVALAVLALLSCVVVFIIFRIVQDTLDVEAMAAHQSKVHVMK